MEIINFLTVVLTLSAFHLHKCETASIRFENELNSSPYTYNIEASSEGDLVYSDVSSQHQEARERLYRQLRQYGVPSDVAQMYVPRGLTIGEVMGKGTPKPGDDDRDEDDSSSSFDPWSIVWYIGSFGGLIAFFLVISCSEWCCLRSRAAAATLAGSTVPSRAPRSPRCPPSTAQGGTPCDSPPPAYHLFAPPSYDDTIVFDSETNEKRKFDVYVVPVHSVTEVMDHSPPPQYTDIHLNRT